MNLTPEQIEKLYKFTRQHYVEHYDLQTELVDHLANGIQEQQSIKPSLTFEEALNIEFKKFGIFGFMEVVDEKQKALNKKYYAIIFKFFKEYFKPPKIFLILLFVTTLFLFLKIVSIEELRYWISGILFLGTSPMLISMIKSSKKLKNKKRKWMLEEMLLTHAGVSQILISPIHFFNFEYTITSVIGLFVISTAVVLMLVSVYIITIDIPSKTEKLLEETYPEYKMS